MEARYRIPVAITLLLVLIMAGCGLQTAAAEKDALTTEWKKDLREKYPSTGIGDAVTDENGDIYVLCTHSEKHCMVIIKMDTNGNEYWTKDYSYNVTDSAINTTEHNASLISTYHWKWGDKITVCPNGDLFIYGWFRGSSPNDVGGILRLDSNGTILWGRTLEIKFMSNIVATSDACYVFGNVGEWRTCLGRGGVNEGVYAVLCALDNNGKLLWNRSFKTHTGSSGQGMKIADDGGLMLFCTKIPRGSITAILWVQKIDKDGTLLWEREFKPAQPFDENPDIIIHFVFDRVSGYYLECGVSTCCCGGYLWELLLDENGNMTWEDDSIGKGSRPCITMDTLEVPDGLIMLEDKYKDGKFIEVAKLDNNGDVVFTADLEKISFETYSAAIVQGYNGSYIVFTNKFLMIKTSKDPAYDSDGDSLPDIWEEDNFGDLDETGSGDKDGDGYTNLEEYEAGSDPNAPLDSPTTFDRLSPRLGILISMVVVFIVLTIIIAAILIKKRKKAQKELKK